MSNELETIKRGSRPPWTAKPSPMLLYCTTNKEMKRCHFFSQPFFSRNVSVFVLGFIL